MKLTMVGTGYVGLVTGTCFANTGNDVVCLDVDPEKINAPKRAVVPFMNPGLPELFGQEHRSQGADFYARQRAGLPGTLRSRFYLCWHTHR